MRDVRPLPRSAIPGISRPTACSLCVNARQALVILWDNAPWHGAAWVHRMGTRDKRWAKRHGQLRVLLLALPRKAPWLLPREAVLRQTRRGVGPRPHASRRLPYVGQSSAAWSAATPGWTSSAVLIGQTHSFQRE
jgi:hypothetical protein